MIAKGHPQASAMESVLVERNKKLVWHVAKKYHWANLEQGDLFTEGVQGLLIAAKKFDPSKGCKFTTIAVAWIRQNIGRAAEQSGTVRVPSHCYESISKLLAAYEVLGQDASPENLCSYLRWTRAKLDGILLARKAGNLASLDAPITNNSSKGDKDTELIDFQAAVGGDPFDAVATGADNETLQKLINQLPPKQALVIRERYLAGEEPTQAQVARVVGLSRERTRQIEVLALRSLKLAALKAGLHAT
jgi:RNA polymerase sigma factor (sigma-70 family)